MRRLIVLLALVLAAVLPAGAVAAPDAPQGQLDVQLWMDADPGKAIAIVSIRLPEQAELPALVRIPIPTGTTIDWSGEIAGTDASGDVQREAQVKQSDGGSYAQFTVEKSRRAQIEVSGIAQQSDAVGTGARLEWVQSVPATAVAFSVRLPAGAKTVEIDPAPAGEPARNELGETLYTLPSQQLEVGEKTAIAVKYGTGVQTGGASAPSTPQAGTVVGVLAAILAVAFVALLVVLQRRPGRRDSGD